MIDLFSRFLPSPKLAAMQQSVLSDLETKKRYAVPSAPSIHAKGIYKALDLKIRTQPFEIH